MSTLSLFNTAYSESVSTYLLYDRWAATYDTDRNPLQILNSVLIPFLLNTLFSLPSDGPNCLIITDLGCGRNTIRFLTPPLAKNISKIHALHVSPAMLEIAQSCCASFPSDNDVTCPSIQFDEFNALNLQNNLEASKLIKGKADIVISTLVLGHLPFLRSSQL
ncbi:hypothetical protein SBOR_8886 [Sclerotinia borealis F-4128]|uniref:Methyltransferase domain-containing protein n=1 Tax=Sclerotinia borealis (strain F-4128) TaxID=1432307 RepID=W9C4B7_SCLBF|nr:hypothetical protein SBOR_8886 [Sclerotinia borealis F-4128]